MVNNWLPKQIIVNVEQWDNSLVTFYPEARSWMSNPKDYLIRLTEECNYLHAVKQLSWDQYLTKDCNILDVGCGGGWLTAYLSTFANVKKITAIDSSLNYLENFLPSVVEQLNGDISKVECVQGLFSPVMLEANSADVIVISSALHHADGISGVLDEFKRVLKPNGYLLILNETPATYWRYLYQISRAYLNTFFTVIGKKYKKHVQKISAGGFLYDPYLGDVDYPEWYWRAAIADSGFKLLTIHNSELATVVNSNGRPLKHFICQK